MCSVDARSREHPCTHPLWIEVGEEERPPMKAVILVCAGFKRTELHIARLFRPMAVEDAFEGRLS